MIKKEKFRKFFNLLLCYRMAYAGYGGMVIGGLRKATDYSKALQTQDQLLKIAVSNDANIAMARKLAKSGATQPVPEQQSKSPEELAQDTAKLEQDTIRQLTDLGFRYAEVQKIVPRMSADDRIMFNLYYPAIRTDIEKKFNLKLLNVETFLEYLKQYIANLKATKGINPLASPALINKFDVYTNNPRDIVEILPDGALLANIVGRLKFYETQGIPTYNLYELITELINVLPNNADFITAFENLPAEQQAVIGRDIQDVLRDLPPLGQFKKVAQELSQSAGRTNTNAVYRAVNNTEKLLSSISPDFLEALQQIRTEVLPLRVPTSNLSSVPLPTQIIPRPTKTPKGKISGVQIATIVPAISIMSVDNGLLTFTDDDTGKQTNIHNTKELKRYADNHAGVSNFLDAYFPGWETTKRIMNDIKSFIASSPPGTTLGVGSPSSSSSPPPQSAPSSASSLNTTASPTGVASINLSLAPSTKGLGLSKRKIKLKKIGKGIAVEEEPKYLEFGKFCIHAPQLHNKILNIKYQSLGNVPKFRPTTISEDFKDFIVMLLDTGKAHHKTYDALPEEERKLFERVAVGAGVFHKLGLKHTKTKEEQNEDTRFRVLKGEYGAGNNNPQLLRELRRMIVKFMNEGRIHKTEGTQLLLELSL